MVKLFSHLRGSLRHRFVVHKLDPGETTRTHMTPPDGAMPVPSLRAVMERHGQLTARRADEPPQLKKP